MAALTTTDDTWDITEIDELRDIFFLFLEYFWSSNTEILFCGHHTYGRNKEKHYS